MKRSPVYIAHQLGPDGPQRDVNRQDATYWCAFLAERYLISPVADWIVLSGEWGEHMRNVGLECDRALVELVGTVILCGPRLSDGMQKEATWAHRTIDLVGMDYGDDLCLSEIDQRMAKAGYLRVVDDVVTRQKLTVRGD